LLQESATNALDLGYMPRQAPYLQRRGDTLSFRIAVPSDLRALLGARELTKTLRTPDKRIAVPIALEFAAIAKRLFNEMRTSMAESDGNGLRELLIEARGKIKLREQQDRHEDELAKLRRQHRQELERAKLEAENKALNRILTASATAEAPNPIAGHENATGAVIGLPGAVAPTGVAELHKLSDTIDIWKRLKNPAPATVEIYEGAVRRFETRYPQEHVETVNGKQMVDYIDWLQAEKLSAKSIEKEHGAIRALLNIAKSRRWIAENPASGLLLPSGTGKKVRSYTVDELRSIFASPVFVAGERPKAGKGEAAYWVPLLLLFTGARREEICQLTTDRIRNTEGVTYLAIDPVDDEGRLKTEESKRAIPVHDALIKLGLLDYVAGRVKDGGGLLFPLMKTNGRKQYGAKWGDWWRRYVRNTVKIIDKRISPAHSFRHLFITECRRLEFREDYERQLVGHVRGGGRKDAHDEYGEHLVPALHAAINRIDFRGFDLSHLIKN
jgi:integrase